MVQKQQVQTDTVTAEQSMTLMKNLIRTAISSRFAQQTSQALFARCLHSFDCTNKSHGSLFAMRSPAVCYCRDLFPEVRSLNTLRIRC
jgi:hypothetical protein